MTSQTNDQLMQVIRKSLVNIKSSEKSFYIDLPDNTKLRICILGDGSTSDQSINLTHLDSKDNSMQEMSIAMNSTLLPSQEDLEEAQLLHIRNINVGRALSEAGYKLNNHWSSNSSNAKKPLTKLYRDLESGAKGSIKLITLGDQNSQSIFEVLIESGVSKGQYQCRSNELRKLTD